MIAEFIISILFTLSMNVLNIMLTLVSGLAPIPNYFPELVDFLETALFFFPKELFVAIITYYLGWFVIHFTVGVIEFIIRKFPGLS